MAVYTLQNVTFRRDGKRIVAGAEITKDGSILQSFSVSLKQTVSHAELAQQVVIYAKDIVVSDLLTADVFLAAKQLVEGREWNYG